VHRACHIHRHPEELVSFIMPRRTLIVWRSLLAIIGVLEITGAAFFQAPITLGFDDIPAGSSVDAGYANRGIHMPFAVVETAPRPHSGSQIARVAQRDRAGRIILEMLFDAPQSSVTFFAGIDAGSAMATGTAQALDENDKVVAQDGPKRLEPGSVYSAFALNTESPPFHRIRVIMIVYDPKSVAAGRAGSVPVSVDDITYQAPPATIDTPIVTPGTADSDSVANPGDTARVDVGSVPPAGTDSVLPPPVKPAAPNGGRESNPLPWLIVAGAVAVLALAATYVLKSRARLNAIQTVPHIDFGQQRWTPANYIEITPAEGEPLTDQAIDEEFARRGITLSVVRDSGSQRMRFRESQTDSGGETDA
jgi:hypothetical protein